MNPATPSMLLDRLAGHDLTPWALLLRADGVVKSVMLILLLASVACWAVIIEKLVTLRRLRRDVRALSAAAGQERIAAALPARSGLLTEALRAGIPEWRSGQGARETDGEFRGRLDHVMRRGILRALKPNEATLQILATTGSVAPFVGLFGTVWGIMNSFSGIAVSNDTSLAVVAPGIAEALFATAMGLAAAIPAVVAYNRFSAAIASVRQEALAATTDLAFRFARTPRDEAGAPATSAH